MRPRLALVLGDPAGVGPELIAAAWAARDAAELLPFVVVGGAHVLRAAAAFGADARAEVGGGDDHRHPAGDVFQHRMHHPFALGIGEDELLGEVGQDAQPVRAGVDHEIDAAALPIEIELAAVVENGRGDGENAAIRPLCRLGH